jgi:hypothetical protein
MIRRAISSPNWTLCVSGAQLDNNVVRIEVKHVFSEVFSRAWRGKTTKTDDS